MIFILRRPPDYLWYLGHLATRLHSVGIWTSSACTCIVPLRAKIMSPICVATADKLHVIGIPWYDHTHTVNGTNVNHVLCWLNGLKKSYQWVSPGDMPLCLNKQCQVNGQNVHLIMPCELFWKKKSYGGIILCMSTANEKRCYNVASSLIGWTQTQNDPCIWMG